MILKKGERDEFMFHVAHHEHLETLIKMQKPLMSQEIILCGQDKASTNTKSTLARKGHMMIVIIQVSKKYDNAFAKYHWSLSHVVP